MGEQKYPFGAIDLQVIADSATPSITVKNNLTRITNPALGQAVTGLALVPDAELEDGARVIIDITQGATGRSVTLNATYATAPVLTGVALDRDVLELVYDKALGKFTAMAAAWAKIVDAA